MNTVIFLLVAIALLSITTLTSYALFTNEDEGNNSINITVSTAGRISVRILTQSNGTEVGTLQSHQNIIKFDVKDGFVMDTFSCTTGEASYNKATNVLTINNATKSGTCEINYIKGTNTIYNVLTNQPIVINNGLTISKFYNSGKNIYNYRGLVNNNYVKFANLIWRIVRTNEDDSIRLILEEGINNNQAYPFNTDYNNYTHGYYSNTGTDNRAKKIVDDWYEANLKEYDSQIVISTFCEQAKVKVEGASTITVGNASMETSNALYAPNLNCTIDENGKGLLRMKIGLISADEVVLAGTPYFYSYGNIKPQIESYLNEGYSYWTMSPAGYNTDLNVVVEWAVFSKGAMLAPALHRADSIMLRPVISIVKDSKVINGNGTETNPYQITN